MPNLTFKYIFAKDYNPIFVNGAWGGITPGGEIAISFYLERAGLPITETHELDKSGILGKVINRTPEEQIVVRYIENGIILTIDGAKTLYAWLGEKIKEAEAYKKQEIELKKN